MVNAFWLDRDVETAAAWLVDAHVGSSVFEGSMTLTTAVQVNGYGGGDVGDGENDGFGGGDRDGGDPDLYFSHENHPLTRWAAESHANWRRLLEYVEAAHEEWRYRWDHGPDERHACWATVESLDPGAVAALDWPSADASDPPQVTDGWSADDYVDAYRYYYANEKRHLFEWSKDRGEPSWIDEYTVEGGPSAIDT